MKNIFSFLTAAALCATTFAQNGLVARYTLDNNVADSTANGLSLTAVGNVVGSSDRKGNTGKAVTFDGIFYGYNMVSNTAILPNDAVTLAAWVYPTSKQNYSTIIGIRHTALASPYNTLWLGIDGPSNQWNASVSTANQSDVNLKGTTVVLNTWTHVAMTYSAAAGQLKIFINGVEQAAVAVTGNFAYTKATPTICVGNITVSDALGSPGSHRFVGDMDEVVMYNRAITPAEIKSLAGISTPVVAPKLTAYYGFCGNVTDLSNNGLNGTLQGSATYGDSQAGTPQNALSVSSINDFADLPDANYFSGGAFTVSSWVKVNATVNDAGYFGFSDGSGSIPNRVDGGLSYGSLNHPYLSIGTTTYTDYPNGTTLPVGQWAHLAWVLDDAGTLKCYINKVMAFEKTGVSFPSNVIRTNCFIGKNSYPVGADASIDEFSIHSTALTQSQIDSLYNVNQCTFISNDAAADRANISLYPNPTNDRISVAATDANILKVEIRSLTGALLATSHSAEVSIAHLAAGLYLVHITTDKGVATQRISKY